MPATMSALADQGLLWVNSVLSVAPTGSPYDVPVSARVDFGAPSRSFAVGGQQMKTLIVAMFVVSCAAEAGDGFPATYQASVPDPEIGFSVVIQPCKLLGCPDNNQCSVGVCTDAGCVYLVKTDGAPCLDCTPELGGPCPRGTCQDGLCCTGCVTETGECISGASDEEACGSIGESCEVCAPNEYCYNGRCDDDECPMCN